MHLQTLYKDAVAIPNTMDPLHLPQLILAVLAIQSVPHAVKPTFVQPALPPMPVLVQQQVAPAILDMVEYLL